MVEIDNFTLANLDDYINESPLPMIACPTEKPMYDGEKCINCSEGEWYVIKNTSCVVPRLATNVAYLNKTQRYLESDNITLESISESIN